MNNFTNMNRNQSHIVLVISGLAIVIGFPGTLYPMMQTVVQQAQAREIQDGWTPLHVAASKGARTDIEQLLTLGARKDAEDNKGRTPLFIAVEFGNSEAVQVLCERKADCTAKEDEHGMTPLHVASWKGLDAVAETLLAHRAAVDEPDKNKKTPLHVASSKEVVKVLIAHNAQPFLKDKAGLTPFDTAAKGGNRELVKAFLAGCIALRSADEEGVTALHRVAQCGTTPEVIKILLAQGGDVLSKNKNGMIPLHVAAFAGTRPIVETLLPLDASQVKAVDKDGETPLHWASFAGHADIADILVTGGADVRALNLKSMIPLHWACEKGAEPVARLLIARRSDVNAKASFGETPLHRAAGGGYTSLVEFLLNNGARVNETDNTGKSAHALAAKKGHKAVAAVLVAFGADAREQSNDSMTEFALAGKRDALEASQSTTSNISIRSNESTRRLLQEDPNAIELAHIFVPKEKGEATNQVPASRGSPAAVKMREDIEQVVQHREKYPSAVRMGERGIEDVSVGARKEPARANIYPAAVKMFEPAKVLPNGRSNILHRKLIAALEKNAGFDKVIKLIDRVVADQLFSLDDLNEDGLSPLMLACGGYMSCFEADDAGRRYRNGFGCCFMESDGRRVIFLNASLEIAWHLLKMGANPNVANNKGLTSLIILITRASLGNVNIWNKENKWDIYLTIPGAMQFRNFSGVSASCKQCTAVASCIWFLPLSIICCIIDDRDERLHSAEEKALQQFRTVFDKESLYQLIKDMIAREVDVNHIDKDGVPTLVWAIRADQRKIMKILLEAGATISESWKLSELERACSKNNFELIKFLIEQMVADPNATNENGENALMCALQNNHGGEIANYLIPLTNDINITSKVGDTALTLACKLAKEDIKLLTLLVEAGADRTKVIPSVYLALSVDAKYAFDNAKPKKHHPVPSSTPFLPPGHQSPPHGNGNPYARYEAEARFNQQQENFERMEASRRAQIAAENRSTNARVAGNALGAAKVGMNIMQLA